MRHYWRLDPFHDGRVKYYKDAPFACSWHISCGGKGGWATPWPLERVLNSAKEPEQKHYTGTLYFDMRDTFCCPT